jgi:cytochrome c556
MEQTFTVVLFVVVGVAAVAAIWALATSSYDQIGSGGIEDRPASAAERETEIRQMLQARNAIRTRRGEAPHDVDAEVSELTSQDPELREEVRALVEAGNARRVARGEPPLDVEAEIDRRLREL